MSHFIDDSWRSNQTSWSHLQWQLKKPVISYSHPFLQLQSIESQHPVSKKVLQAYCVDTRDWVNIFGLTPEKKLIVVMQFRFGTKTVSLETPGGIVDLGESHQQAAVREFQEETGFSSSQIHYVGALTPNAATHTNKIHFYFFKDCFVPNSPTKIHDDLEYIEVALISLSHFESLLRKGYVDHALIMAGFFLASPHLYA